MDMNFPHDSIDKEQQNDMIDLDIIRSTIISNACARQLSCETVKRLQKSNETKNYSRIAHSVSPLKGRIIFFARSSKYKHDDMVHHFVKGSFFLKNSSNETRKNETNAKYESDVNLNNSNYVKSSALKNAHGNNNIAINQNNSSVNRG